VIVELTSNPAQRSAALSPPLLGLNRNSDKSSNGGLWMWHLILSSILIYYLYLKRFKKVFTDGLKYATTYVRELETCCLSIFVHEQSELNSGTCSSSV
jgi:hypothetical protein